MLTKSVMVFAVLTIPFAATAQTLFSEGFNYTSGGNLGGQTNPGNSVVWTGGNVALAIGSSSLSYSGFQTIAGNDLVYTSGGTASTSINTYAAVNTGSIYYSFLIDCTTAPTANNYLTALNGGTSSPGGSTDALSTYVGVSGSGYKIGIRTLGSSGGAYSSTTLSLNTTYLIVEQLTIGGASDSVASIYVDPVIDGNQSDATVSATQTATSIIASVADIGFKAQSAATAGAFDFGSLRVGTTWASVTPAPEPSDMALAGMGIVALGYLVRRLRR